MNMLERQLLKHAIFEQFGEKNEEIKHEAVNVKCIEPSLFRITGVEEKMSYFTKVRLFFSKKK